MACPVILVALLLAVLTGDAVRAPGHLPMSRPSDGFSTKGAVTPSHVVLDQPQARFQQPLGQPLCQRWEDS